MGEPFAIKVTDFGGMTPRSIETLLDNRDAALAVNCRLRTGGLEGYPQLQFEEDLNRSPIYDGERKPETAFAIGSDPNDYIWLPFRDRDVMLVRGTIVNDKYDRYYWTGDSMTGRCMTDDGAPKYNTEERIRAGDPALILGVPAPIGQLSLAPAEGSPQTSRAYTYTFVSPYGEESAPVAPVVATGGEGSWTLTGFDTTLPDLGLRAPGQWKIHIYRTVSGQTATSYFYVDEIDLGTTDYVDSIASDLTVLNSLLESEDWEPPPEDLDYLVAHPNGFLVGFSGSDIYMSVPFRPHAWPSEYVLSTEFPIVALGVFGQSIAVATRANPYVMSGVEPLAMTFTKTSATTPCLSRYGLVAFDYGVLFPSDRGLILVDGTQAVNVTEELILPTQWREHFDPDTFVTAVRDGDDYLAFNEHNLGFVFAPKERAAWSQLDAYTYVSSAVLNTLTGTVSLISSGVLYRWDEASMPPVEYTWRSKDYDFKKFINLGAARAYIEPGMFGDIDDVWAQIDLFNVERAAFPLAPIGTKGFGSVRVYPLPTSTLTQNQDPAAGSAMRALRPGLNSGVYRLLVWADSVLVLDTLVGGEEIVSLASGFKAQRWQFEVTAYEKIDNFAWGTSPKALAEA